MKNSPEVRFEKYSLPCAYVLLNSNRMTRKEFSRLEYAAINNKALPKDFLESKFIKAFERMRAYGKGRDIWDADFISDYFINGHNLIIEKTEATREFKELCMVHKAVIKVVNKENYLVEYKLKGKTRKRKVKRVLVPDANKGDIVTIHHHYAVEKI